MADRFSSKPAPRRRSWSWRSRTFRGVVYQVIAVSVIALAAWFLTSNTLTNLRIRGIQSGFDFVIQPAGFGIGETVIEFDSSDPYWKAFLVGLTNTLRVAIVGILLSTALGTAIGIGRLSRNFLVRAVCSAYVEIFRNIPVLLQLLMWYLLLNELLPPVSEALHPAPGMFLSKGGFAFPVPVWSPGFGLILAGATAGIVCAWLYRRWTYAQFALTGHARAVFWPAVTIIVIGVVAGWFAAGMPTALDMPAKTEFNVVGGGAVTPEFLALTLGLTIYTASFIAEIVRSGIQAVPWGQIEAASALGLSRGRQLKLVLLPQALRVIIPPLTNQYLNLTKNSSLAVAIGYPDLVSISNTTLNQTGRAVECITIIMAVYLTLSLSTAALMNWYNARAAIRER
ncbi:MAG TPA: ABC transporter permease subunit [Burkholderiaceae bacterium]|nr:ABC transporter permease subunit [Burkholderiaceae bacterium]